MMFHIILLILLICFELIYFKVAIRFNIIDKPNSRSSHVEPTIRGGGIVFWVSAMIYFVYSGFHYVYFFIGLTLVSIISFLDDIFTLPYRYRLPFQFIGTYLMLWQINFNTPLFVCIVLLIICVGILNAYNFMDGVNGMTGGYNLVNLLSLFYINNYVVKFVENEFIIFVSLGIIAFNIFNFRKKAKCFSGDIGSISIAFIIVFLLMKLIVLTNQYIYILFLTLYGIDTVFTLLIRIWKKENIFTAHKKHFFQILVHKCNFLHLEVSLLYMCVQLMINLLVIILVTFEQYSLCFSVIPLTIFCCVYIYYRMKIMKTA